MNLVTLEGLCAATVNEQLIAKLNIKVGQIWGPKDSSKSTHPNEKLYILQCNENCIKILDDNGVTEPQIAEVTKPVELTAALTLLDDGYMKMA